MTDNTGPQHFKSASHKLVAMKTCRVWKKISWVYIKKTKAEKRTIREKNLAHHKSYAQALADACAVVCQQAELLHKQYGSHSVQYYHQEIIQVSHIASALCKASMWNAYLSSEIKRINGENPNNRRKANDLTPEISACWKAMSKDKQDAIREDLIPLLEEQREMKALACYNVPLESCADAQKNLQHIESEIKALHAQTGTEVILFAVRASLNDYMHPYLSYTSDRTVDVFAVSMKKLITDVVMQYEAFCLSGVEGLVNTYAQGLLNLKSKTSALILEKLWEVAGGKVSQMNYQNFDDSITAKLGIVIEGWLLSKFCSPSNIKSRNEVSVLFNAWSSGMAHFQCLTAEQWREWEEHRFDSALAGTMGEDAPDEGNPISSQGVAKSLVFQDPVMTVMSVAGGSEAQLSNQPNSPQINASHPNTSQPNASQPTSQPDSPSTSMPNLPTPSSSVPVATNKNTDRSLTLLTNRQADGTTMILAKKPRKPRCNKGTTRESQENTKSGAKRKNKNNDTAQRKKKKSAAGPNMPSSS